MQLKVLVLPGDGIGPEVVAEAVRVLRRVCELFGHDLHLVEGLLGGEAIRRLGTPLPEETRQLAEEVDAILLGAVGLPEFDHLPPLKRPERGLLELRKQLGLYANLRPVRAYESLLGASPLKEERIRGCDLVIIRELTGGLYYGEPRGIQHDGQATRAINTMVYTREEIERVGRTAFELARARRRKVTSVDKANVLENSQLWRQVMTELSAEYPDVELEHLYVDNCAMQLILRPAQFDVVVTENMFGDILSDEAAVLAGSIGMLPSASLGGQKRDKVNRGLYEPVHGSAPDIAGKGIANPLGTIASVAAMLAFSFGLSKEAEAINSAIEKVLNAGIRTADLNPPGKPATTSEVGQAVCQALEDAYTGAQVS